MTDGKSFKGTLLFISGVFLTSLLLISFLNPDLWFHHNRRLLASQETEAPLDNTFILISHFFHGGIQLWGRFDQMNNAYYVLSNGIYGVANLITAFFYIILSPFLTRSGEALYYTQLFLFYGMTCFITTIGGYLLLRKFVSDKAVLFISLLYLNTIFTSYLMTPGFEPAIVYSFFPLLIYFILNFFEELRLRSFLLAVLVLILCLVNSLLFTLGYFYQAVHAFILACTVLFLFQRGWHKLQGRQPLPRVEFLKNVGLAAACLLIVLPYYYWGNSLTQDHFVPGSGLGGTHGRFNNMFNLSGYFSDVQIKSFANPIDYLGTSLDYHHNVWGASWIFIGGSTLFLALAGLVLSKDRRKYIFLGAIFFVILINTACFPGNFFALGQYIQAAWQHPAEFWAQGFQVNTWVLYLWLFISSTAHGINALTNPFSFLVRSFHMASLLTPVMFLPLVAMGLDSCFCLWKHQTEKIHFKRRWLLLMFYGIVLFWAASGGTRDLSVYNAGQGAAQTLKWYILSLGTIFFVFVLSAERLTTKMIWLGWLILGFAFAVDFVALMTYDRTFQEDYAGPVRFATAYTRQAVIPDYQNPRILPLREFFDVQPKDTYPLTFPLSMYGAFVHYPNMGRFFHPWVMAEPRIKIFKDLYPDTEIQQYLINNPRFIFFADYAFDPKYLKMADILHLGLGARVVLAEPNDYNKPFLKTAQRVYLSPMDVKERVYSLSLDWSKARIHQRPGGWEYSFDLPGDFPSYLSTTVFTNDYTSWRLMLGDRILDPMQGTLITPFTFDVQNIQDRTLTVLLPDEKKPEQNLRLQVKLPQRIIDVWKNTYDDLGLTYEAPKLGWMVFNYPYDEKWELSIDGLKVPLSKVNRYFIGAPITEGKHQVLLRYWPDTPLRFLIFISAVLSIICFGGVIYYGLKRELLAGRPMHVG